MKSVFTLGLVMLLLSAVTSAQAVVCANGVYRAGCAGPHGAVVVPKNPVVVAPRPPVVVAPKPVVVVPPANRNCAYVNGVRVCR